MLRPKLASYVLFSLLFAVILSGCEIINTGNDPGDNDDPPGDNYDPLSIILGTWVEDSIGVKLSIKITNYNVLFQLPWAVDPSITVTNGNFRLESYDGTNINILDYDDEIVTFTGTVVDDKLSVSGLNAIKWTAPPFDRRDYRAWNSTYVWAE
jgi:hypothetical protein